jgi:hypothetical protein
MSNVKIDYQSMGLFLRTSPELRSFLEDLGKKGVSYARGIAPVGSKNDKHPGAYRDSINAEIHQSPTRQSLRIGARDFKAHWIEYGSKRMPKFSVLRNTMDYLTGLL